MTGFWTLIPYAEGRPSRTFIITPKPTEARLVLADKGTIDLLLEDDFDFFSL